MDASEHNVSSFFPIHVSYVWFAVSLYIPVWGFHHLFFEIYINFIVSKNYIVF